MEVGRSYACSASLKPYTYRTYTESVQYWAWQHPRQEAFVEYGVDGLRTVLKCEQLEKCATSFGRYLLSTGFRKGDSALLCMKNSINLVIASFGVIYAGGISTYRIPIDDDGTDVIENAKRNQHSLILMDVTVKSADSVRRYLISKVNHDTSRIICNISGETDGKWTSVERENAEILSDILNAEHDTSSELPELNVDDTIVYFQSSGTTGNPKLIGHTHFSYFNSTFGINDVMGLDSSCKFYCDRPLVWGVGAPRTFLASGATRIFTETTWALQEKNLDAVCEIIAKEECSHVYLPAYQIINLLKRPQLSKYFRKVRCIKFAGERFKKRYTDLVKFGFCHRLVVWYGSTEAAGVSAFVSDNLDLYEDGIIGKPLEGVEMKIVDDFGRVVPRGETGLLSIKSVYRFVDYRDQPGLFDQVVDSRDWLKTGDSVHMREDGNFVMDGRSSEQISYGGLTFFPWDLETFFCSIEGVANAAVVTVPDESLDKVICACLIIDEASGLTIERVKLQCEAHFFEGSFERKLKPKLYLEFMEFPLNSSGKLDRRVLVNIVEKILLKSKP